ncbi:MAG: ABC transporter ATP-binding protein [Deltaproteobacteria bacterium]
MSSNTQFDSSRQAASPCLRAIHLRKTYTLPGSSLEVLKDVNLELHKGEIVGIIGTSGTGKTTLLHILGGLDTPSGGKVLYLDQDIFKKKELELCRFRNRHVGFVFQFHYLMPEFTAIENTIMPGLIGGVPKKELFEYGCTLLEQVGLEDRLHHKIGELSGGEQQRVALARALSMKPQILLADEPTGNLDPKTGQKVFDLIRDLNHRLPLATVMVTHNRELASQMDRCLTLFEGKLHSEAGNTDTSLLKT